MQDSRKVALFWLAAFGVVLVIVGAWFWWDRVQTNPQNVFWQTLSQGLATQSTTIEATQSQSGATAHQTTAYTLGTKNIAHALVTLKQGQSTIKTEVIGTTDTDYTRYTAIDAGKSGKQLKTSSVLNVWARSDGTQQSANQASSNQLLREAALGVGLPLGSVPVPIANLTSAQRADLLQQMRDNQTYQTDFSKVGKTHENGRLYYTYEVNIFTTWTRLTPIRTKTSASSR